MAESNYAFFAGASSDEVESLLLCCFFFFSLAPFGELVTHLCLLFILCSSAICFNLTEGDGEGKGKGKTAP